MADLESEVACEQCELFGMCRTVGLGWGDDAHFERVVSRRDPIAPAQALCEAGAVCGTLFAVKSGLFASVVRLTDGQERIVAFHYPGELIGVEGVASGRYACTVRALGESSVCRMRIADLPLGNAARFRFEQHMVEALSRTVQQYQGSLLLIGSREPTQALAAFLLGLLARFRARDLPASAIRLPMRRADIANHLGLEPETVEALLAEIEESGVIEVRGRHLAVMDSDALHALAGLPAPMLAPWERGHHETDQRTGS